MSSPIVALLLCCTAFLGVLLHLRWDRIGWARVGELPLTDPTEVSRDRA